MAADSELTIVVRARDAASATIEKVRQQIGTQFTGSMQKAEHASVMLATGLLATGVATTGLGIVALQSAGNYEQQRVAFETMLGSADRARKMMSDIAEFAKSTPFELPEVVQGSKMLIAYGFAQGKVIDTMRRLGDVSAGVGVPLNELVAIYGKARTQGTLFTEDFDQFTGRGIPMAQALSGVLGVSADKVRGLASEGKITFDVLEKGFKVMTDSGGQFGGMMDKQSKTFSGVMSNIKDGFGQTLRSMIGITAAGDIVQGGLFDKIKIGAERTMPIVQNLPATLTRGFDKIRPYIPMIAGAIMVALVPALIATGIAAWSAIAPLLPFIAIGAALGVLIKVLVDRMGGWNVAFEKLKTIAVGAWQGIKMAIDFLMPSITALWGAFTGQILPALTQVWNSVTRLWSALNPALMDALKIIGTILAIQVVAAIWLAINTFNIIINVLGVVVSVISVVIGWIANLIGWFGNLVGGAINAVGAVLGWFGRLPGEIGGIISAVVGWFTGLPGRIGSAIGDIVGVITGPFKTAFNSIAGFWNNTVGKLSFKAPSWVPGIGGKGFSMPQLPTFAKGVENFDGGLAITGERGPELGYWPRGTNILSNKDMKEALGGKSTDGSITINFQGPVYMRDEAEADDVAGRLARQLRAARAGSY